MVCKKCGSRMICKDSKQEEDIRYRYYVCPDCNEVMGTKEIIIDTYLATKMLSNIRKEKIETNGK